MSQPDSKPAMSKMVLFFCLFTSVALLCLAWAVTQINHTPWGLVTAAILVLGLTAQQLLTSTKSSEVINCESFENAN